MALVESEGRCQQRRAQAETNQRGKRDEAMIHAARIFTLTVTNPQ